MNLKRFFAKDMRTALAEIKDELGSDAIIMSSKKVDGGIEIVAAVEDADSVKDSVAEQNSCVAPKTVAEQKDVYTKPNRALSGVIRPKSNNNDFNDDRVNISSATMSKSRQENGKTDDLSTASLKQKQEKFADSLAALLARQESVPSSDKITNSSAYDGNRASMGFNRSTIKPRSLAEQNANRGGGMNGNGLNARPKIIDKTDANLETKEQINSLSKEVEAIRRLLQFQLAGLMQDERSRDEPIRAMISRLLVSGGFSQEIADRLSQKVNADNSFSIAWQELARILENNLRGGNDTIMKNGGAVALVGPTGVGKTTTLAKIAARFALKYGSDQVALISTDHYRIGASEQLQTYGRIMGCTVKIVEDVSTLSEVLYQLRSKSLVLIDTAGFGQRDVRLMNELTEIERNAGVRLQHYLVLPATAQRRVLEDAYARFSNLGIDGLVLTKIDESMSLGDAASLCLAHDLELSYITTGQRVPEDIEVTNISFFVQRILSQIEEQDPELTSRNQASGLEGADWARNLKVSE